MVIKGSEATNLDSSSKQEAGDASPLNAEDGIASPSLVKDDLMEAQDGDAVPFRDIKGEINSLSERKISVSVNEIPLAEQSGKADANDSTPSSSNMVSILFYLNMN